LHNYFTVDCVNTKIKVVTWYTFIWILSSTILNLLMIHVDFTLYEYLKWCYMLKVLRKRTAGRVDKTNLYVYTCSSISYAINFLKEPRTSKINLPVFPENNFTMIILFCQHLRRELCCFLKRFPLHCFSIFVSRIMRS
jgi:hypothetical protein